MKSVFALHRFKILGGIVLLVFSGIFYFGYFPWAIKVWNTWNDLMVQKHYASRMNVLKGKNLAIEKSLSLVKSQIQDVKQSNSAAHGAEIMSALRKFAVESNLEIKSITSEGEKIKGNLREFAVTVYLSGSYHNIGKWLTVCSSHFPAMSVKSLAMEKQEFTTRPASARIEISVFAPISEFK